MKRIDELLAVVNDDTPADAEAAREITRKLNISPDIVLGIYENEPQVIAAHFVYSGL